MYRADLGAVAMDDLETYVLVLFVTLFSESGS
jgi:hypothetical protein